MGKFNGSGNVLTLIFPTVQASAMYLTATVNATQRRGVSSWHIFDKGVLRICLPDLYHNAEREELSGRCFEVESEQS